MRIRLFLALLFVLLGVSLGAIPAVADAP